MIFDAHLDLAYNASIGRAVTRPAVEQTPDEQGTPSVGLPDLRAGDVRLVCGTLFAMPVTEHTPNGYKSSDEAHAAANQQLYWYRQQEQERQLRIVRRADDLQDFPETRYPIPDTRYPSLIVLMEGADPILTPVDAADWFNAGVRIVGLAWRQTRYAGGTGAPGPLTSDGVDLVRALDALHIIHDVSHLAERSFWQLLDISAGPVMASHSNCRVIVDTDRQLSDEMIRAIVVRGGVIGINLFDKFLVPADEYGKRRVSLADIVRHIRHICDIAGNTLHVGLGTDMDGGFGAEHLPPEIRTSADLPKLRDSLADARFSDAQIAEIMHSNWLRFFRQSLPE